MSGLDAYVVRAMRLATQVADASEVIVSGVLLGGRGGGEEGGGLGHPLCWCPRWESNPHSWPV